MICVNHPRSRWKLYEKRYNCCHSAQKTDGLATVGSQWSVGAGSSDRHRELTRLQRCFLAGFRVSFRSAEWNEEKRLREGNETHLLSWKLSPRPGGRPLPWIPLKRTAKRPFRRLGCVPPWLSSMNTGRASGNSCLRRDLTWSAGDSLVTNQIYHLSLYDKY